MKVSGNREKMCIAKENNFAQAGARFRSFDPARQERFINRIAGMLTAPRVTQVCCQLKHQLMLLFSTASVQHMPVSLQPLVVANSESGLLTLAQAFQIADVPCCCRMLNWSCFYVFRQCRPAVNCILMCELPALIHMRRLTAAQTHCSADSLQRRLTAAQTHCSADSLQRRLTAAQTHCSADSLQRRLTAAQSHCSTESLQHRLADLLFYCATGGATSLVGLHVSV